MTTTTATPAAAEVDPTPAPDPADAPQTVDVTPVLGNIDAGSALRDRIKELQAQLKVHEDAIKDVLGPAIEGTDATGNVVIRYPHRNRTGLAKAKVKALLSDEDFAKCEQVTDYRTLLYGEG